VPGELEQAMAHGIAVEGVVTAEVKGGYQVQIGSVRAFCPGSQIDRRRGVPSSERQPAAALPRHQDRGAGATSSSRGASSSTTKAAQQAVETWERLQVGNILQGRVSSVRDFGAFVDLGGVEA
jgi:small subunit ribosomal protein S1